MKRTLVAALAAIVLSTPAVAQITPANVTMTIDLGHPGPVIEPAVEGQFAENLGRGIYGGIWAGPHSSVPNLAFELPAKSIAVVAVDQK